MIPILILILTLILLGGRSDNKLPGVEGVVMSDTYRSRYEALVAALPEREQRLLACDMARRALARNQIEDPRLWEALDVSERYAEGLATQAEFFAAWDARAAAEDDAWDAAYQRFFEGAMELADDAEVAP